MKNRLINKKQGPQKRGKGRDHTGTADTHGLEIRVSEIKGEENNNTQKFFPRTTNSTGFILKKLISAYISRNRTLLL